MRKVVSMGMAAVLLAMALGGCATSNQKAESPAGTEAVSSQAEGETKEEKAESTEAGGEAAAETESGEAAAQLLYADEISKAKNKAQAAAKLATAYAEENLLAPAVAKKGYLDNVIEPALSRPYLIAALQTFISKEH